MKNNISECWTFIESYLDQAVYANSTDLADGANMYVINYLEELIHINLPDDIHESYQIHDGVYHALPLFYGGHLLSILEIISLQQIMIDYHFIPLINFSDFTEFIGIDMKALKIFIYTIDEEDKSCRKTFYTENFTQFLNRFVNDLEEGNGIMGELFN